MEMQSFFRKYVNPETHIITVNKVRPKKGVELDYMLTIIAAEESTGTESVFLKKSVKYFTPKFETAEIREKYGAKITSVKKTDQDGVWMVEIAYPVANAMQVHPNMPMLLTIIIGDHNGLPEVDSCRLEDIRFPKVFLKDFKGPKFGIDGIRLATNVMTGPLIGAIVKPNLGLTAKQTAAMCYEMAINGINFIKDDELLTDTPRCRLVDRVRLVTAALDKASEKIGRKTLYAASITSSVYKLKDNAIAAIENGANCLMVNFLAIGYDGLRMLAEDPKINVPIHTHRCGHDIFTRDLNKGVAMSVLAKLARINGADNIHIGNVGGKTPAQIEDIKKTYLSCTSKMGHIRTSMPTSSRIVAGEVKYSCDTLGEDLLLTSCAGVHRHPMGRAAGVKSLAHAVKYYSMGGTNYPSAEFQRATEI